MFQCKEYRHVSFHTFIYPFPLVFLARQEAYIVTFSVNTIFISNKENVNTGVVKLILELEFKV